MGQGNRRSVSATLVVVTLLVLSGFVGPFAHQPTTARAQEEPSEPTAQELIAFGLEAGELDYPTTLIYRAYALFGDSRLPGELVGGGSGEDAALFHEVRRHWEVLPESAREELIPFIVRPTDPRSVFASRDNEPHGPQPEAATGGVSAEATCAGGWATGVSQQHPDGYKVWMPCRGDYVGDVARAISVIDEFWQTLIDLMGPPKPDMGGPAAGGDPRIDFYFVESESETLPRPGGMRPVLGEWALAVAIPVEPYEGNASSGFMVARRSRLHDEGIKLDLAHEFFHILQFSHNVKIGFGYRTRPYGDFDILQFREFWFVEAMAVWAEAHLYRGKIDEQTMVGEVHRRFIEHFQTMDVPLYESPSRTSPEFGHMYAAYIWFFFMEQEVGTEPVLQIWRQLQPIEEDDWDGAMAIIDAALPFKDHFRDFAVRNLNLDLQPGDPISPSYKDLDPVFPEGIRPPLTVGEGADRKLLAGEPRQIDDLIKSLTAHYFYFVPEPDVAQLTIDFGGLTPAEALDVDLIVKIKGGEWQRRQLPSGQATTFCFDEPADNVEAFYLILSNHDMKEATSISGSFSINPVATPCF